MQGRALKHQFGTLCCLSGKFVARSSRGDKRWRYSRTFKDREFENVEYCAFII